MSGLLNPWCDAQSLSAHAKRPNARLVVALGAEAWCERCRQFRARFEAHAHQADTTDAWVWLDLEEHAEFLAAYIPDDLPLLMVFANGALHTAKFLSDTASLDTLDNMLHAGGTDISPAIAERIFATLTADNWAR